MATQAITARPAPPAPWQSALNAAGPFARPGMPGTVGSMMPQEWRDWGARAATAHRTTATAGAAASATTQARADRAQSSAPPVSPRELALLSQHVYTSGANPPAGWRVAGAADLAANGVSPSQLSDASGFRARVYVDNRAGMSDRIVVAFRGSSEKGDWVANGQQAIGQRTVHYDKAMELGSRLARAGVPVTMTGHSLGGGLASAAGLAAGRPATTFNAAGLHANTLVAAGRERAAAGVREASVDAYFVRGEILSAMQDGGDKVVGMFLGRAVGGTLLGPLGAFAGTVAGRGLDAPEAFGRRIELPAIDPGNTPFYREHAVARHGMDWVLAGLGVR